MMIRSKNSQVISNILTYLTAISIILDIGCVYTHMGDSFHLQVIVRYLPIIFLTMRIFLMRYINVKKLKMAVINVSFIFIYLAIYMIISKSKISITLRDIVLLCIIFMYYVLIESDSMPKLLIAYRNVIFIIAAISIFMWLFCCILRFIPVTSIETVYWGKAAQVQSYFMVQFESEYLYLFGQKIICNRSFFVERAFAAFAFLIGGIYELFIEKEQSKVRLIVLFMAIITTFSMTGIITTIFTVVIYYAIQKGNFTIYRILKWFIFPIMLSVSIILISYLLNEKISQGRSVNIRLADIQNGIIAWKTSPIFGYGYSNADTIDATFNTGYSNSISMILTRGGIWILLLYILAFFKGIYAAVKRKNLKELAFIIVFIIPLSATAIAFTDIVFYLLSFLGCGMINMANSEIVDS